LKRSPTNQLSHPTLPTSIISISHQVWCTRKWRKMLLGTSSLSWIQMKMDISPRWKSTFWALIPKFSTSLLPFSPKWKKFKLNWINNNLSTLFNAYSM
jgi:hypothetical protein